jgi:hypothetical protein
VSDSSEPPKARLSSESEAEEPELSASSSLSSAMTASLKWRLLRGCAGGDSLNFSNIITST